MGSQRILFDMMPHGYGTNCCEPFDDWLSRHQSVLPNFPPCILRQWVFAHWQAVLSRWGWLDFNTLQFEKQVWTTSDLIANVHTPYQATINTLSRRMQGQSYEADFLVSGFNATRTWPFPPIVLKHSFGFTLAGEHHFQAGLSLIEGHHRWAALLAALHCSIVKPDDEHHLWLVQIKG